MIINMPIDYLITRARTAIYIIIITRIIILSTSIYISSNSFITFQVERSPLEKDSPSSLLSSALPLPFE